MVGSALRLDTVICVVFPVEDHFRRALGDAYDAYFSSNGKCCVKEEDRIGSNGFVPTAMETDHHQQGHMNSSTDSSSSSGDQRGVCNGNREMNGRSGEEKGHGEAAEDDDDLDRLVIVTDDDCCLLPNGAAHS